MDNLKFTSCNNKINCTMSRKLKILLSSLEIVYWYTIKIKRAIKRAISKDSVPMAFFFLNY